MDHQHGQYFEHFSRSIVSRELKEKQRRLLFPSRCFSQRDEGIYFFGGGIRTNSSNMGEPMKTRRHKLAGRCKLNAWLVCVVQVHKRGELNLLIWAQQGRNLIELWWNKIIKSLINKKKERKKSAYRGQSVRYRWWWKQHNTKVAVSDDHVSCWVRKVLTVTPNITIPHRQALLIEARV